MNSKKKLLKRYPLYVILDKDTAKKNTIGITAEIIRAHDCLIQFRAKNSKKEDILKEAVKLRGLISGTKSIFIINDHIDIAKMADSDGIHLGQDDDKIEITRRILGGGKIIGISCHNLKQAKQAQDKGADYIGIGPIFPTPTKPDYKAIGAGILEEVGREISIPCYAIGGIDETNIEKVLNSGAKAVAVCRAVCRARNIKKTLDNFYSFFTR